MILKNVEKKTKNKKRIITNNNNIKYYKFCKNENNI